MVIGTVSRALKPNRYLLVVFAFLVLFPVFMDIITPDVIHSYAGGTVDAQGNVVTQYEGGNGPQYQWYYPLLYPFMLFWYLSIVLFDFVDVFLPNSAPVYYGTRLVYFYLLAAIIGGLLQRIVRALQSIPAHLTATRE